MIDTPCCRFSFELDMCHGQEGNRLIGYTPFNWLRVVRRGYSNRVACELSPGRNEVQELSYMGMRLSPVKACSEAFERTSSKCKIYAHRERFRNAYYPQNHVVADNSGNCINE